MIFYSEFSTLYKIVISIALLLLLAVSAAPFFEETSMASFIVLAITLAVFGFIIWCTFATNYTILNDILIIKSGPIVFRIKIDAIQKIENHNGILIPTMWKLGFSHRGIIITYNTFDDVYISPKNKAQFIAALQKINPNILTANNEKK